MIYDWMLSAKGLQLQSHEFGSCLLAVNISRMRAYSNAALDELGPLKLFDGD